MKGKLKKALLMCLCMVLVAVIAIGGTIAYLTDRESKVNVFTVGDVDIELNEDFEQGAELIPGVKIEKEPTIENTGKNDAWVWATVAIPATLDDANDASKNIIHFNYYNEHVNDEKWTWKNTENAWNVSTKEIDGVNYNVYTVLYQTALKPGETTPAVIHTVYMDTHVDITPNGDWYWVDNGETTDLGWNTNEDGAPKIYVNAYAIQVEGFETVQEAYDAYIGQWGELNGTYETVSYATTADELAAAIAKGGKILIENDITVDEQLVISEDVTLMMADDATLSGEAEFLMVVTGDANLTIVNGNYDADAGDSTGNKSVIFAYDNANVVIEGGSFDGGEGDAFNASVWTQGNATVTIKNGTFVCGADSAGDSGTILYARDSSTIHVEGGYFKNDGDLYWGYNWLMNTQDYSNAKIVVTGGTFVGLDPSNSWPADGNCVADGYTVIEDNGSYTVVAE